MASNVSRKIVESILKSDSETVEKLTGALIECNTSNVIRSKMEDTGKKLLLGGKAKSKKAVKMDESLSSSIDYVAESIIENGVETMDSSINEASLKFGTKVSEIREWFVQNLK